MSRLNTDRQTDIHVNIELELCEVLTEFAKSYIHVAVAVADIQTSA